MVPVPPIPARGLDTGHERPSSVWFSPVQSGSVWFGWFQHSSAPKYRNAQLTHFTTHARVHVYFTWWLLSTCLAQCVIDWLICPMIYLFILVHSNDLSVGINFTSRSRDLGRGIARKQVASAIHLIWRVACLPRVNHTAHHVSHRSHQIVCTAHNNG